ncbi:L,D-transpeptidase family protein [Flavobacterium covae]|uniref:L,D-transpeptidase family protein n=2 Tax=Flavobacterium covae TaxID=2906076 RepID=UPI000745E45C|nr:L,D-transpeptidase family protein [Flavobacterium covae]AMA50570.1 hypothetical protein AWN65_14440 [Flavobacterium covae]
MTKVAATYNKYMKELGMNTCWNKAHFFAQALIESGPSLHVSGGENFNWYWEILITTFSAFQTSEGKQNARIWGRPSIKPKLPGVTLENQKKIANWAYSYKFSKGKEIGNTQDNDGWNFRGKGLLQLTGRTAYEYANTYTKKEGVDIIRNPDLVVSNTSIAVLSSMAFWKWKNLNTKANLTKDVIGKICSKVGNDVAIKDENGNPSTNHKEKKKMFDKTTSRVFKIEECKLGKASDVKNIFETYDKKYKAESNTCYIDVIVPSDRRKEGLFIFFDNTGIIQKGYALAMGTKNNAILIPEGKGSTPTGLWSSWYEKVHIGESSYGDYGLIKVSGISGDALKATNKGRAGIAIHCGHTVGNSKKEYNDNGALMVTYGCVRVYNKDMKELVQNYKSKSSKKIYVYVEETNDIEKAYEKYGMTSDSKDYLRTYSKKAKQ